MKTAKTVICRISPTISRTVCLLVLSLACGGRRGTSQTLSNGSFESPNVGSSYNYNDLTNWTGSTYGPDGASSYGAQNLAGSEPSAYPSGTLDHDGGAQFAYINSGSIYQDLGPATVGNVYRISGYIGSRLDDTGGQGSINLYAFNSDGTPNFSELLATTGVISPAAGTFQLAVAYVPDSEGNPTKQPYVATGTSHVGVVLTKTIAGGYTHQVDFNSIYLNVASSIVTYPAPAGSPTSSTFSASVGASSPGTSVALYGTPNRNGVNVSYGYFDFTGDVTVSVTPDFSFSSYQILPASAGVTATQSGSTLTFSLAQPTKLTFVFNGDYTGTPVLHLFANAVEGYVPSPSDPSVIYYGPGYTTVSYPGISIPSNETLYVAGGAFVNGFIETEFTTASPGSNISVLGHGIIQHNSTSTSDPAFNDDAVRFNNVNGLTISGVIFTRQDVGNWTGEIRNSSNITVDNYKAVSPNIYSTDALDFVNSHDVTVKNSFFRSGDDCIAIKGFDGTYGPVYSSTSPYLPSADPSTMPANYNIVIEGSQFWSDQNNALVLGEETEASSYNNITFDNLDLLYVNDNASDRGALSIISMEPTSFSDILYKDIRVGPSGYLINIQFASVLYTSYLGNLSWPGSVSGVTFQNITQSGGSGSEYIYLHGYNDSSHTLWIQNIDFNNVVIGGNPVTSSSDSHIAVSGGLYWTSNLTFSTNTGTYPVSNGVYKLINQNSGLAMEVEGAGTSNGSLVDQNTYEGQSNQQWTVTAQTNGTYTITGVGSGLGLEDNDASTVPGQQLDIWAGPGAAWSSWVIAPSSTPGWYTLTNGSSSMLADVSGQSTATGAAVVQNTAASDASQLWAFQAP